VGKLWLTYAWKDNEDDDVDHIVSELRAQGLDVNFDRVHIVPGRRLWAQIDQGIMDPDTSAWAIYLTENSLRSEPCQEEIAYALDRALRSRGAEFPLIGLFPGAFDRHLIPSAIATRLFVNLRENDWVQQVLNGVSGSRRTAIDRPKPFGHALHKVPNGYMLEVWPRTGHWAPTYSIVSEAEGHKMKSLTCAPRGVLDGMRAITCGEGTQNGFFGRVINNVVDAVTVAQVFFSELPEWVEFGPASGPRHKLTFIGPT
jgi:TIR domain